MQKGLFVCTRRARQARQFARRRFVVGRFGALLVAMHLLSLAVGLALVSELPPDAAPVRMIELPPWALAGVAVVIFLTVAFLVRCMILDTESAEGE